MIRFAWHGSGVAAAEKMAPLTTLGLTVNARWQYAGEATRLVLYCDDAGALAGASGSIVVPATGIFADAQPGDRFRIVRATDVEP